MNYVMKRQCHKLFQYAALYFASNSVKEKFFLHKGIRQEMTIQVIFKNETSISKLDNSKLQIKCLRGGYTLFLDREVHGWCAPDGMHVTTVDCAPLMVATEDFGNKIYTVVVSQPCQHPAARLVPLGFNQRCKPWWSTLPFHLN